MKVLVVGSGAREHALAWRLGLDGAEVVVAPGNGGTTQAEPIAVDDLEGLAALARRERVDLTIVGPEAPLAAGLVDVFAGHGLAAFGPRRAAARIEASKAWSKDFFVRHGIPTAAAEVVDDEAATRHAVARRGLPVVLKADGLAAGKGVFVIHTAADLEAACETLFQRRTLGAAASQVLVEDCLAGPELSVMAFVDGERLAIMPAARDYKRLADGDRGPNTGGMGGQARPSYATDALLDEVRRTILEPTLAGLAADGILYRGVLYAGLMLTRDGPRVLEFNCRFGDPEGELVLPLLDGSLLDVCQQVAEGALEPTDVCWKPGRTYGVVVAAPGYPQAPRLGAPIGGLNRLPPDVLAFHAGTAWQAGRLVTAGGRVLTLVGADRAAVYSAVARVQFEGKQYRADIGLDAPAELPVSIAAGSRA